MCDGREPMGRTPFMALDWPRLPEAVTTATSASLAGLVRPLHSSCVILCVRLCSINEKTTNWRLRKTRKVDFPVHAAHLLVNRIRLAFQFPFLVFYLSLGLLAYLLTLLCVCTSIMSALRPPERLDLAYLDEETFEVWLAAYKDYKRFAKHFSEEEAKKDPTLEVSLFLTLAGVQVRNLVKGLTHDDTFTGITQAIRKYIRPFSNVVVERNKFFSLKQEADEDIQHFLVRLKQQVIKCDFTDSSVDTVDNQMVRDQFIKGLAHPRIRECLLKEEKLTLKRAETLSSSLSAAELSNRDFEHKSEHVLVNLPVPKGPRVSRARSQSRNRRNSACFTCGKTGHLAKDCYKNHTCKNCRKVGHTEKFCRAKRRETPNNSVNLNLSSVEANPQLCFIDSTLNDHPAKLLVDTGSTVSLVSRDFVEENNMLRSLVTCEFSCKMADGSDINFSSFLVGRVKYGNEETVEKLYVANELNFNGLIGINCIKRLGLRLGNEGGCVFSLQNPIAVRYSHVFDKPLREACLKEMKPLQVVQLKEGTEPVQCKVKAISRKDKEFADQKISELLKEGVIRPSNSPWRSQPLVVPKDNGSGKRLVINYKPLNDVTEFDAFPLPDVNALFQEIGDAKFFSKIDFLQFYHQLPLLPEDIPKTAFHYEGELYEYTRCPFGLKNAVAYCFRIMRKVLEGCRGVTIYMDDLCVTGSSQEEHDRNLSAVLKAIEKHGLSLNSTKCQFSKTETSFLGFKFKDQERFPDPERYSALRDFKLPTDAKALQRFIGMVGFFSNFISNYSDLITPLYSKLKKFQPWTDEEIFCFESLKTAVFNSALYIPNQHEPLFIYTDASDIAISGVLVNAAGKPIQFCSRKLTEAESHYDIVEREALAVYWSINRCRTFLLGRQFVVFSDHKGLQYIFGNPNATPKVIRWKLNLSEYNFEIRYYRGSENLAADCFSRINFIDETPLVLDLKEVERRQKTCQETKAFLKAYQNNYVKKPKAVSPTLWSCRKDVTYEGNFLKINEKIFVPKSLRYKCLVLAHGCHVGQDGTYDRLRETFFWPKMKDSAKSFVEKCRICSLTKPQFKNPPMAPILTQAPFDCLAADYIGPLPSSQGYRYCLTVIDVYSRYPFVFPVKSLETSVLCECFRKIFAMCGYPDAILSDRGTNFESRQFQTFCQERGIRKLRTTSYNPKGNSICERFNKTFKSKIFQILTAKCLDKSRWISCVDLALHDYRFSVHSTTSFRPVDLFFSFRCRGLLPFTLSRSTLSAAERMQQNRFRAMKFYDKKRATAARFFKKGEKVLLRNPLTARTFEPKVVIVQVVQDISPECVRVRFPNGRIDLVNKSRISKFTSKHKEGNSGSAGTFDPCQIEPCRTEDLQPDYCTRSSPVASDISEEKRERERLREEDREEEPRRSRRVRFQTLPYDSSDPRDPQLLKWGNAVTP